MKKGKQGLASCDKETRLRVAKKGGTSPHPNGRGVQNSDNETKHRVALAGGTARGKDRSSLAIAGYRGGVVVKERYGQEHYKKMGKIGGASVAKKLGSEYMSKIGKKGGMSLLKSKGKDYFSKIGKKGRKQRWQES